MILSYRVQNYDAVQYLINEFAPFLYDTQLIYDKNGEPVILNLYIYPECEDEALETAELVNLMVKSYQADLVSRVQKKSHQKEKDGIEP